MKSRSVLCVLWPSFLMAGLGSAIVFAFIDPLDVAIFGYIQLEREWLYAAGFFLFWFIAAASSFLTLFIWPPKDSESDLLDET
ncbi:MAG: hypothetical protein R6V42_06700 [Orrella sp.]